MKRYTGQQALYEAISRSRAKGKQGSILEKLRPDLSKPENHAATPLTPAEPQQVPEPTTEPVVQASPEPQAVETLQQPVIEHRPQAEPQVEAPSEPLAEMSSTSVEQSEPIVKPRPIERVWHVVAPGSVQTWLKPRPVQLNEGRIEISVPYYVGAIAGLVLLLMMVIAFRLGHGGSDSQANKSATPVQSVAASNPPSRSTPRTVTAADTGRPASNPAVADATRQDVVPTAVQGDNWIVLAQYSDRKDLEPVKEHFAQYGIELGIMPLDEASRKAFVEAGFNGAMLPLGPGFLLVTKNLYSNPKVVGSDGYLMKQKITEVGAKYKARPGLERFAPSYFSDAYPMKIRVP